MFLLGSREMKKVIVLLLCLLTTLVLSGGILSCQSENQSTSDEDTIRAYADPATETTLQGLSENNLAKYIQYGSPEFKAAMTEERLTEASTQIDNQLGTYQSKEFLYTEEQEGYILVHYKATYTKGEVGIRMVFDKDHRVAGQWFE